MSGYRYPPAEEVFAAAEAKLELAQQLLARGEPAVEGDQAWAYLVKHRRLPPDVVRTALGELRLLEPPIPGREPMDYGVASLIRDRDGEVSGIELAFVDCAGAPALRAPHRQTYALRPDGVRDGLFHAGGPDTGLALLAEGYCAKPLALVATDLGRCYGGGARTVLGCAAPPEKRIVIVTDRRPVGQAGDEHDRDCRRAADLLLLAGAAEVAVTPNPPCACCKDSDAVLHRHGFIRLADWVRQAKPAGLSADGEARKLAAIRDPLERDRLTTEAAKRLKVRVGVLREVVRRHHDGETGGTIDERASAAEKAVAAVVQSGAELWADDGEDSFATFDSEAGARCSAKIPSLRFEDWLRDLYGAAYEREIAPGLTAPGVLPAQAYEEAWKTLRSMARRGPVYRPCIRVGHADGRLYLDLADRTLARSFVEVRHTGEIELVAAPAARLIHLPKALPLPVPVLPTDRPAVWREFDALTGGSADRTRAVLTRGYLFSTLFQGPHVGAVFTGDPGGGKTTAASICKAIVDPAKAGARLRPRTIEDFIIGAYGGWVGLFDNLSGIAQDFSDVACKILDSTGISRRTLYTTADETVIELGRPLAFTSINDHLVWSPDLIDRVVVLHCERIEQRDRLDEDDVLERTVALRPRLLGLLLQAAAKALGTWQDQTLVQRPRRLGIAKWIEAAHAELGLRAGEFLEAYLANQEAAMKTAATTNPVVAALLDFIEDRHRWAGMTSELYADLTALQRTRGPLPPRWPTDVRAFGAILSRARIALRALGVELERDRERPGTTLTIEMSRASPPPVSSKADATLATDATDIFPGAVPEPETPRNPPEKNIVASVASVASDPGQSGSGLASDIPEGGCRDVLDGEVLPPGMQIEMNMKTGRKRARPMLNGEEKPEAPATGEAFLTCATCNGLFPRPPRGRLPKRCPACRRGAAEDEPPIRGADGTLRAVDDEGRELRR